MNNYLFEIGKYFADENSSEHSYRTTFENYLKEIFPLKEGYFTQQDQKAINGNKPDFVILKNKVPILYIEVKKVGEDLGKIEKSNQADRYFGYDNLIISDYIDFRFFRNGQNYGENILLATIDKKSRTLTPEKDIETLSRVVTDFVQEHKEPIKRGKHLAQIMGGKAQRIRDNVLDMLNSDSDRYNDLLKMRDVVKENLVTALDNGSFADMYAQTLIYGLFAARYNDETADTFSRTEARDLVPKTNPFLRSFFDHIAGTTFPERLRYIVDELCEAFSHADVHKLLTDFYATEKDQKDPIIHFYEDFLREYDAKKKIDMGVFYTPQPVVQFIVRAVDSILKTEFGLVKGLADTTKICVDTKDFDQKTGKEKNIQKEYHKVQVLDVATGTGTFLNEVIHHIYHDFKGQEGRWEAYVKENLLPRLHGFELMMASYTIAHLKLGMTLQDSGVRDLNQRLGVYLTNTLDAPVDYKNQNTLFGIMDSIAEESKNASRVKSEYPIMCVIGNPPYAISSNNKTLEAQQLISDYKDGLNILNKQPLSDDYIKFIAFGQKMIEKNKEGILAYISNRSYLEGIVHKEMRNSLMKTFNKIYIIDLNGDAIINQVMTNDGGDKNVFDIKQGVAIGIFVKDNSNLKFVKNLNIRGSREFKFNFLENNSFDQLKFENIKISEKYNFFTKKELSNNEYENFISIGDIFIVSSSAIATGDDDNLVAFSKSEEYKIPFSYRPFDERYINYSLKKVSGNRYSKLVKYLINDEFTFLHDNFSLCCSKNITTESFSSVLISKSLVERKFCDYSRGPHVFPLYIYKNQNEKVPNLNKEIWDKINQVVGKTEPKNILDYIYAVLHSPAYREKYKEFLKIDFPRIPYPKNKEVFWELAKLGEKLCGLHLMTDLEVNDFITTFPAPGTDEVEKISYKNGKVFINTNQYFGDVPEVVWNFYIGGYQPAQKWLKDRKGQKLTNDEIEHYQKIIKVIAETDKIMKEIDSK